MAVKITASSQGIWSFGLILGSAEHLGHATLDMVQRVALRQIQRQQMLAARTKIADGFRNQALRAGLSLEGSTS